MSPRNYIRLSPGEEARLKHDENRKQKLARLQQVREQERILASERRKLYQTVAESELGHVLNLLEKDWTASRRQKINQLKNVQDKHKQLLGQAHRTAEQVAADEKAHNESLYSTTLDRIKLDVLRGQEALAEVCSRCPMFNYHNMQAYSSKPLSTPRPS
ncbi:uncharacterized protein EV422DRAFT_195166 [Fimicolochytrium jonesii]|uniref:uncharacterized protein n=1 Tax=Fimicolochytrium jonesii TaxID=1396493 RepID=UPI0022FF01B8|nr:uncharacterized protein EV422DRAFT_195166 [Fimicolochytrium jonesii]KAI8818233.1 hypothetical protein EV422DRAFT_195166 [Fimicolochytrium jonesii]